MSVHEKVMGRLSELKGMLRAKHLKDKYGKRVSEGQFHTGDVEDDVEEPSQDDSEEQAEEYIEKDHKEEDKGHLEQQLKESGGNAEEEGETEQDPYDMDSLEGMLHVLKGQEEEQRKKPHSRRLK